MSEAELLPLETPRIQPMQVRQEPTPMALLQVAMDQGADLDKLTKLMELQERWEANEARKAYLAAFAAFKAEAVTIVKNISVTDGPLKGKKYADLFAVVDAITPALSKHGLSLFWKLTKDEKDWLEVTAILRHELGHTESVSMGGPPDAGGAKNAIQARASAKSYLERYTAMAITGMAASGEDTDGRPKAGDQMPEEDFQNHIRAIREARTMEDLQRLFSVAYKATSPKDKDTQKALMAAKDDRKAQLQGGSK